MNFETAFWKSRAAFWAASAVLALSIFFVNYDFAWRPHQSLPQVLFFAALAPLELLASAGIAMLLGRLFRVPVEWKFLVRLEVWLVLLATPIYFLNVVCERNFALQQSERAFATFASGALITLWILQIVRRYKTRANSPVLRIYCALYALITAGFVVAEQRAPSAQVMGAQPWKWQTHGRVNLAYTEEIRDAEFAREDARNTAEMLRRVEKALGTKVSARRVNVFLFPDDASLSEFAEADLSGVAGEAGVLLVGYEWEEMRATLVHELSHFVVASEFGPDVRSLPDEGTAVWLEQKLAPGEEALVPRRHDIVTSTLAENQAFFDEDETRAIENYEQAGWLAKTTIQKHGLAKWRQFLRVCHSNLLENYFENPETASSHVAAQYQQVFGAPMP